ncbi:MAG: hypothetical protein N3D71_13590, partial [Burkholderiaceae bacterium]|nr:hypothetical protein [Burkholderiaceae bacterium]
MIQKTMAAAALAAALVAATPAAAQTEIQWWHSMGGALGEALNELATKFNDSQKEYKVVATYKGSYPESMTAAIAAFRAEFLAADVWIDRQKPQPDANQQRAGWAWIMR